jgi:ABC-type Mn2+/Zn2+ transport system ATPase subunit
MKLRGFFPESQRAETHASDMPPLEISGVTYFYGNNKVLDNISLRVQPGERVAVIGPNGAGKSTLFKVIAGVLVPASGKVLLFGEQGPAEHICIAYLPQRTQVDWNFPVTVSDVVMMGRVGKLGLFHQPTHEDWRIVHRSLESVKLDDLAHRQISELSGGQQQRMFIARALAQEAQLILMDEPLNGLDTPSQQIIFEILDSLHKKGVVVMVATHDLDLAAEQFDNVLLINRHVIGYGKAAEVFSTPHLLEAYGGHMHMIESDGKFMALGDTCCDDEPG